MPTPTLTPGDEKQDEKLNPGQQDYDRRFSDIASAEEKGTFDDIVNNYDQTADSSQEDANVKKAREQESESTPNSQWQNNVSPASSKGGKAWFKRKGPLLGIGGGVGIIGIVLSMVGAGGAATLLPNITHNAVANNDSRSTILDRRLAKIISYKMGSTGDICSAKTALCNAKRVPKSMLSAMKSKGIVALGADAKPIAIEGNGYTDKNPSKYEFTDKNGNKTIINADEFAEKLKSNKAFGKAFKSAYNHAVPRL